MTNASPAREAQGNRHLLLVDDDRLFLEVFSTNLKAAGYSTTCCGRPSEALAMLDAKNSVDGCIVDLDMPEQDGMSFIRVLAARAAHIPLMVVTSHSAPLFEQTALELGVREFVDKGRGFPILMYRIDLMLSQPTSPAEVPVTAPVTSGNLQMIAAQRLASWNGVSVNLTRTELAVIELLASRPGTHVGYREIYDVIKTDGFAAGAGEDGFRTNVRAAIKRIRRKFADIDPDFNALENYPGVGYRWCDHG